MRKYLIIVLLSVVSIFFLSCAKDEVDIKEKELRAAVTKQTDNEDSSIALAWYLISKEREKPVKKRSEENLLEAIALLDAVIEKTGGDSMTHSAKGVAISLRASVYGFDNPEKASSLIMQAVPILDSAVKTDPDDIFVVLSRAFSYSSYPVFFGKWSIAYNDFEHILELGGAELLDVSDLKAIYSALIKIGEKQNKDVAEYKKQLKKLEGGNT